MLKRWLLPIAAGLAIAAPVAAMAAPGYATASVNMRAGPGPDYPVVDRIPGGAHVDIHGCLSDRAWCDVSWSGDRGWVSATFLDYFYRNRYVYLPTYFDVVAVPIVTFDIDTYWGAYYRGRPWYHRFAYWRNFWVTHGRYGFARNERPNEVVQGRAVQRGVPTVSPENRGRFEQPRTAEVPHGRVAPGNLNRQARTQAPQRIEGPTHFTARPEHFGGPAVTRGAPNFARGAGAFGNARPGGAAHIGVPAGASHIAGPAGPGAGGGGRERHRH